MRRPSRRRRGITLLETLMTAAVLILGIGVVASTVVSIVRLNRRNLAQAQAYTIAEWWLERVTRMGCKGDDSNPCKDIKELDDDPPITLYWNASGIPPRHRLPRSEPGSGASLPGDDRRGPPLRDHYFKRESSRGPRGHQGHALEEDGQRAGDGELAGRAEPRRLPRRGVADAGGAMKRRAPSPALRGFTLLELVVASSLSLIVLAAALWSAAELQRRGTFEESLMEAQNTLRAVREMLVVELQRAGMSVGSARMVFGKQQTSSADDVRYAINVSPEERFDGTGAFPADPTFAPPRAPTPIASRTCSRCGAGTPRP
ncbi:prepilin-type N-terminal cleavage/methylation domain-containing protein [Cystobacter fuscus]